MRPNSSLRPFGSDEATLQKTDFWRTMGGYGISPDMLELTGFWPQSVMNQMRESNIDTSMAIEQITGGMLRFKPLPGKKFEARLDRIIGALNKILQAKRHINDVIDWVPKVLKEEWNSSNDSLLPEDLNTEIKELVKTEKRYIIAEDPQVVRHILSILPVLKGLQNRIGYYSATYAEANTIFHRMVLETVNLSFTNMSMRDSPRPEYIELEQAADVAAQMIIDGEE